MRHIRARALTSTSGCANCQGGNFSESATLAASWSLSLSRNRESVRANRTTMGKAGKGTGSFGTSACLKDLILWTSLIGVEARRKASGELLRI